MLCLFGREYWKRENDSNITVTIAMVQSDKVQNPDTNYYKEWLEEKTGYQLQFEYIQPGYEKEYIHAMLTSDNSSIDAVFFSKEEELITKNELQTYVQTGLLRDITSYTNAESNLNKVLEDYQLRESMEEEDGRIYYMPNMDTSRKKKNFQVMWINMDWLKQLEMQIPRTSDELYQVLTAFRDKDPNGNGLNDELPLIGCEEDYKLQSYNYLLNMFCYNDPLHMRFYEDKQGVIRFSPTEESFREGLRYCALLYEERLYSEISFSFTKKQVMELVNDPANLVGAFTSQSIADIIYANSTDVISKYIYVPPLEGPEGEKNAIQMDYEPILGGCIPTNSTHPKEAYEIMELMLSDEASLISEFGEEAVDWEFSDGGDLSAYGNKAIITTLNYLKNNVQNKNFAGVGPQVVKESYIDGVTWNGNNSLLEYMDARAIKGYEPFYSTKTYIIHEMLLGEENHDLTEIQTYTDEMIKLFITGKLDINSEEAWNTSLRGYDDMMEEYINDSGK